MYTRHVIFVTHLRKYTASLLNSVLSRAPEGTSCCVFLLPSWIFSRSPITWTNKIYYKLFATYHGLIALLRIFIKLNLIKCLCLHRKIGRISTPFANKNISHMFRIISQLPYRNYVTYSDWQSSIQTKGWWSKCYTYTWSPRLK